MLGKYRIEARLGQGGFGSVYRATDVMLGRQVAIKTISQSQSSLDGRLGEGAFETYVERFQREAMISAFFTQNRNIIVVYGLERDQDSYYLILEHLEGGSLFDLLKRTDGPLPVQQACSIALDICNGLREIHQHPADIVHRDLKPGNILLRANGEAVVADFGIAQLGRLSQRTDYSISPHPGSPAYRSPEQAGHSSYLTPTSDLYGLGLLLYEMLTGRLYARVRQLPASQFNPQIPPWLDVVVGRLLQENPQQRYQSAGEVADSIRGGLASPQPGPTPPAGAVWGFPAPGAAPQANGPTESMPGSYARPRSESWQRPPYHYPVPVARPDVVKKSYWKYGLGAGVVLATGLIGAVVLVLLNNSGPGLLTANNPAATATSVVPTLTVDNPSPTLQGVLVPPATFTALPKPTVPPTPAPTPTVDIARQNRNATATAQVASSTARVVNMTATAVAALTPPTASPQLQGLIADFEKRKRSVYGPAKGKLTQDQTGDASVDSGKVSLSDFVVEARFFNAVSPLIGVDQDWDYGFVFRESDTKFYHLFVTFRQSWDLYLYETIDGRTKSSKLASGKVSNLDISEKGSNRLKLYAEGDAAYFYINDIYIATLPVAVHKASGDVGVIAGANSNQINGKLSPTIVVYENFTIHALG